MKVPLLDLKPQYRALKPELDAALLRVSESQYFILGPEVEALEAEIAKKSGFINLDHELEFFGVCPSCAVPVPAEK